MKLLLVLSLLVLLTATLANLIVIDSSEGSLKMQEFLCRSGASLNDTVLALSVNYPHRLSHSCILRNVRNLTIMSSSPSSANINCSSTGVLIGIIASSDVKLTNLRFHNCEGNASSSGHEYALGMKTALLLVETRTIVLTHVTMYQQHGLAVLCINMAGVSLFHELSVIGGNQLVICSPYGSGVVLLYDTFLLENSVQFNNSNFSNNCYLSPVAYPNWKSLEWSGADIPIAGGLTIISHNSSNGVINVTVTTTNFTQNCGPLSGGAAVLVFDTFPPPLVNFTDCLFTANEGSPKGTGVGFGLSAYFTYNSIVKITQPGFPSLILKNSTFRHHKGAGYGSGMFVSLFSDRTIPIKALIQDFICYNNTAVFSGHCVAGTGSVKGLSLDIEGIEVYNNGLAQHFEHTEEGILYFNNVNIGTLGSGTDFVVSARRNHGSVFYCFNSDLTLTGNCKFAHNIAFYGGALHLDGSSNLLLNGPINATFINNSAIFSGGAIFALSEGRKMCAIQFNISKSRDSFLLQFVENHAQINGESLYIAPIFNCFGQSQTSHVFEISNATDDVPQISSLPKRICQCNNSVTCTNSPKVFSLFPGQLLTLGIVILDEMDNSLTSRIVSTLDRDSVSMSQGQSIQYTQRGVCSNLEFAFVSRQTNISVSLTLYAESKTLVSHVLDIYLLDCPPGFNLSVEGVCECVKLFSDNGIVCNTTSGLIAYPFGMWIGVVDGIPGFVEICAISYCIIRFPNAGIPTSLLKPDQICEGNRVGTVCGQCLQDFSKVLGDTDCYKCSNWYLLTIPLFALAGVVLVIILYALRLTISLGTINGVVFFLNLASVTTSLTFSTIIPLYRPFFVMSYLLNLDLGFPLCLYDGMTELGKAYLRFVFPFYLILLVGLIVLGSRHSSLLARATSRYSIQVLATLLYLSYAKIVSSIIYVLQFQALFLSNNEVQFVWYGDASISYLMNPAHIILFCFAIIIIFFFILPYTILLTVTPFLARYKIVNKFKPFLDAHFGPYKDRYRYWFAVRLWVIVFVNGSEAFLRNYYEIFLHLQLIVLILLTAVEAYIRPYKNKFLNFLDNMFIRALYLISITSAGIGNAYIVGTSLAASSTQPSNTFATASQQFYTIVFLTLPFLCAVIIFVIVVCIVCYHIHLMTHCKCSLGKKNKHKEKNPGNATNPRFSSSVYVEITERHFDQDIYNVELREPALDLTFQDTDMN